MFVSTFSANDVLSTCWLIGGCCAWTDRWPFASQTYHLLKRVKRRDWCVSMSEVNVRGKEPKNKDEIVQSRPSLCTNNR